MLRLLVKRSWLVLALTALAGAAAWLATASQTRIYERTLSFVLRPSELVADEQVPDAVRGLSQQDAQLVNTIANAVGSPRFLRAAVDAGPAGQLPEHLSLLATVRPGSDIVEVHLRGADPSRLAPIAEAYRTEVTDWVAETYRAYRLEFLDAEASEGPVAPRVVETVGLAAILGFLLGVGIVFAESRLRDPQRDRAPRRVHAPATEGGPEPGPLRERVPLAERREPRAGRFSPGP